VGSGEGVVGQEKTPGYKRVGETAHRVVVKKITKKDADQLLGIFCSKV